MFVFSNVAQWRQCGRLQELSMKEPTWDTSSRSWKINLEPICFPVLCFSFYHQLRYPRYRHKPGIPLSPFIPPEIITPVKRLRVTFYPAPVYTNSVCLWSRAFLQNAFLLFLTPCSPNILMYIFYVSSHCLIGIGLGDSRHSSDPLCVS